MKHAAGSGYRLLKRSITLVIVVAVLVGATVSGAFAHGTFDGGEKVGKVLDYGDYSLASSTYAITSKTRSTSTQRAKTGTPITRPKMVRSGRSGRAGIISR